MTRYQVDITPIVFVTKINVLFYAGAAVGKNRIEAKKGGVRREPM